MNLQSECRTCPAGSERKGFTLVELLVVIAIIGVLVALLVPAVNGAREMARKATCTNNLRNLGQTMTMHQTDKQAFPGRINFVMSNPDNQSPEVIPVSWMAKLLPYMDKGNVWDTVLKQSISLAEWNSVVIPGIATPANAIDATGNRAWFVLDLELATCPSDPATSQLGSRTSYAMNSGIWDRSIGDTGPVSPAIMEQGHPWQRDSRANGVGQVLPFNSSGTNKVDLGYISKGDGSSSTILITENVNAVSWAMLEEAANCVVWTNQEIALPEDQGLTVDRQYGINQGHELYLDDQLLRMSQSGPNQLVSIARPSSNHSGGVNVVYCDGHVEFLSADIHPWEYARRLSVNKSQAIYPGFTKGEVPSQVLPQDSSGVQVGTDL